MVDSPLARSAVALLAALSFSFLGANLSYAQAPTPAPSSESASSTQIPTPPRTPENSSPAAAAQRQGVQPFNNAPVWREVRSNTPGITTVVGRETNVLMQPQGQTWRTLRNSNISVFGGWALVLLFLVIATFYWVKGTLALHAPPTGRVLLRFTLLDRVIHWSTAITFCILAISGLIMLFGKAVLLPLIGYTLFSWLAILGKNLHNFAGPLFSICVLMLLINFVRDNFPGPDDWQWIRHFGGLLSKHEPPSGRFNAGEKIWFWGGACVLGIIVSASGFVLDFPNFDQTRQTMQIAHVVHSIGAILFMLGAMGHIYMGTLGMAGAYDAMRTGYVDEEWAREHHAYWYNEVKAGRDPVVAADPRVVRHTPA
ncbi:MAG TPA: formate dehydrogenase subunit gamma [Casimicrobiaceae bacterium]|nr:formate dehydrogenase subunit gamma [Casimicrobiaceae bacterium]